VTRDVERYAKRAIKPSTLQVDARWQPRTTSRRSRMPTDPRDKSDEIAKESHERSMAPLENGEAPQTPAYEDMQTWPEEAADVYYGLGGEEP
jgi:hypothetical protein